MIFEIFFLFSAAFIIPAWFKKFESWWRYSFCRPLIVMFALDVSSIKLFPKLEVASARVESWSEDRYPYFGLNRIK
jgi:hypothetical protein